MKTLLACAFAVSVLSPSVRAENAAEKAEALYNQGRAAEAAGDAEKATTAYRDALKLNPNHANALFRLGEVKLNAKKMKTVALKTKIEAVVIPVYQIDDTPFQEAIDLLVIAVEKNSNGEITPNFVIEDPNKKLDNTKITMSLKNVPVKAILDYLTTQANTKVRYDEHAVVIIPR